MGKFGWDGPTAPAPRSQPPEKRPDPVPVQLGGALASYKPNKIKAYGPVDQETLEAIAVAKLLKAEHDEKLQTAMGVELDREAEEMASSAVQASWFENKFMGAVYEEIKDLYAQRRRHRVGFDEVRVELQNKAFSQDQVENYVAELRNCHAALISRQVRSMFVVERLWTRFQQRLAERLWHRYMEDRKNPNVGAKRAIHSLRTSVLRELADKADAPIKDHDWMEDYESSISKLVDMKLHPDKYMGYKCGIGIFDEKTKGFRPGHLTVFVGAHGGFKTTSMLNVAYGLWENGYNVLYASLEMEADLVEAKLWVRAAEGRLSFSKIYDGRISDASDFETRNRLQAELEKETDDEKKKALETALNKVNLLIGRATCPEETDKAIIEQFYEKMKGRENRIKIINAGQSSKVKVSQIERWLEEVEEDFKPHVLILDYLDLVAPETPYPDRRDQELGDVCKYLRQMGLQRGFAVITAAQFKRPALERIRKSGDKDLGKAQVGTDDIAGSHQIGADADEVFMLFREAGGNRVRVLTPKARHGTPDIEDGVVLEASADACMIDDKGRLQSSSAKTLQQTMYNATSTLQQGKIPVDPEHDEDFISSPPSTPYALEESSLSSILDDDVSDTGDDSQDVDF